MSPSQILSKVDEAAWSTGTIMNLRYTYQQLGPSSCSSAKLLFRKFHLSNLVSLSLVLLADQILLTYAGAGCFLEF